MTTLSDLYQQFVAHGWNQKATRRILAELAFHFALLLGGLWVVVVSGHWAVRLLALYVSTLGLVGVATNSHSAVHYAASRKRWINWLLSFIGYPLVVGLSATYWRHKHVIVHHATPNVVGLDEDIDLMPFFAISEDDLARVTGWRRWIRQYQWLVLPPAVSLNAFNMQRVGWAYLIRCLRDPEQRSIIHWIDLGTLILHQVVWVLGPMLYFPVTDVLLLYVARFVLLGYGIFIVFAPAHFPAEALFLSRENKDRREYLRNRDFALLQCATTTNLKTTWFGNLFCSGTDYQIEHHLFPGVSHPYYPKMAPLVKKWCEEHGYPYRTLGFVEGNWKTLMAFRQPKPVYSQDEVGHAGGLTGSEMVTESRLAEYNLL